MGRPWASEASTSLGRDVVTVVDGRSFAVSGESGDIEPGSAHGFYADDTRYVSELRLTVNGVPPEPLVASARDPFRSTFVLRDRPAPGAADSGLVLFRTRAVGDGMREELALHNFGVDDARCVVELGIDVDFADLFDVKSGGVETDDERAVDVDEQSITWRAARRGARAVRVDVSPPARTAPGSVVYDVVVPAGGSWTACLRVTPMVDAHEVVAAPASPATRLDGWRRRLPAIEVDHAGFAAVLARSTEDLGALRLFDADDSTRPPIAAGAPWFMTLFGRDSLLASWMAMLVDPDLALGTLEALARRQGTEVDPATEEEPGRILHEIRTGASATHSLGGATAYYGSVDATPLFVMLLGELRRWGHRREAVDALVPAADAALAWIEDFGDRDGDGYVEYERTGDHGLLHQGWKDSLEGTRFADGRLARPPVALCEVQGYVYAALLTGADFATDAGDHERAARLRERARELKARFNRDFWLEERGWFAMGLDRDKRALDALTSNLGHCLWTGIVDRDKAARVGELLASDALFSGWGIRTLADSMVGYHPVSYHTGSVWPHDNAVCVAGLLRYGMVDAAHRVVEGLVAAAGSFDHRLPELFAGVPRTALPEPVGYPTSCSPQAWAAASPLLLLRALLRLEPDAPRRTLHLAPALPGWLGRVRLRRVAMLGGQLSIDVDGDECRVIEAPPGVTVLRAPPPPTAR